MKKIIIISLAVITLGGLGALGYFVLKPQPQPTGEDAAEVVEEAAPLEPLFVKLHPPLVVNFTHQGVLRYLQATLQMMHTDQEVIDTLEQHMPIIRNNLILLLSDQSYDDFSSKSAKEDLRDSIADTIAETVPAEPRVEVYITSFVMQ